MQENHNESLMLILRNAQVQILSLGGSALIAPLSLPQGYSLSLIAGDSEHAIVAAFTAQGIGADTANAADEALRLRFASDLADHIADRAIAGAASKSAPAPDMASSQELAKRQPPSVDSVLQALMEQTRLRGGCPSVREISNASLAVASLIAAYSEVRAQAVQPGMSLGLARAIESADQALAVVQGSN